MFQLTDGGGGVQINTVEQGIDNYQYVNSLNEANESDPYFKTLNDKNKENYYSGGLTGRYFLNDGVELRLIVGISKINSSYSGATEDSIYHYATSTTSTQTNLHITPCIGRNLFKNNRVRLYGGFQTPIYLYGQLNYDYWFEYDNISNGALWYSNKTTGTKKSGYSIGIGAFEGFSINIYKNISIGAEYNFSLFYSMLGGAEKVETVKQGTMNITYVTYRDAKNEKLGNSEQRGSIYLSFEF